MCRMSRVLSPLHNVTCLQVKLVPKHAGPFVICVLRQAGMRSAEEVLQGQKRCYNLLQIVVAFSKGLLCGMISSLQRYYVRVEREHRLDPGLNCGREFEM